MRLPRARFTVRRMMLAIAGVGVACAVARSVLATLVVLVSILIGLAIVRTRRLAKRYTFRRRCFRWAYWGWAFLDSSLVVVLILAGSLSPLVIMLPEIVFRFKSHGTDYGFIVFLCAVSLVACVSVGWGIRRLIW